MGEVSEAEKEGGLGVVFEEVTEEPETREREINNLFRTGWGKELNPKRKNRGKNRKEGKKLKKDQRERRRRRTNQKSQRSRKRGKSTHPQRRVARKRREREEKKARKIRRKKDANMKRNLGMRMNLMMMMITTVPENPLLRKFVFANRRIEECRRPKTDAITPTSTTAGRRPVTEWPRR